MVKILIIEDDQDINHMLRDILLIHQMESVSAYSGSEGLLLCDESFDMVLLDLMLPGKTGQEVIHQIKEKFTIPVIVLTAMSTLDTKLELFALGANDYITKPFHPEEVIARVQVHLKKERSKDNTETMYYKDLKMIPKQFQLFCHEQEVLLSKIEFRLLELLMTKPNQVFTKENLFELVWDHEDSADDNTLNVHISKLRSKLKKVNPKETYIETVWSIGYKMK